MVIANKSVTWRMLALGPVSRDKCKVSKHNLTRPWTKRLKKAHSTSSQYLPISFLCNVRKLATSDILKLGFLLDTFAASSASHPSPGSTAFGQVNAKSLAAMNSRE